MKIYWSKHNDGKIMIEAERHGQKRRLNWEGGSVKESVEITCNDNYEKDDIVKLLRCCADYIDQRRRRIRGANY